MSAVLQTDYCRMLEEGHDNIRAFQGHNSSRLEYLGDHIFNFTTYDGEMSELFASKALEVCAAISAGTTYDYIKDKENYRWFLLMCNMPFFAGKLEWGTSIRGPWWLHDKITLSSDGLWLDGDQIQDTVDFTGEEWRRFVEAMLLFTKE